MSYSRDICESPEGFFSVKCLKFLNSIFPNKKPFNFHKSTYKKLLISLTNSDLFKSYFKKTCHSFAEEISLFPLLILRDLCDESCFCVQSKAKSHFTVKLLQKGKRSISGYESPSLNMCTVFYVTMECVEEVN